MDQNGRENLEDLEDRVGVTTVSWTLLNAVLQASICQATEYKDLLNLARIDRPVL